MSGSSFTIPARQLRSSQAVQPWLLAVFIATVELGPGAISVKLGGKTVEVCCEECAAALKGADAAATTAATGKN
jgi:hypothetical protein